MSYKHLKFPENSLFLVTGAAGFIGSNLCEAILDMGYRVRALDDLSTGKQKNVDMFLDNPRYEFIKGDIKDLDTCMKACEGRRYPGAVPDDCCRVAQERRRCDAHPCKGARPKLQRRFRPLPYPIHKASPSSLPSRTLQNIDL